MVLIVICTPVDPDEIGARLSKLESLCRQRGIPLTVQRRDILKAVLERDDHPTADQVYESAQDRIPGLSRTTVYRVLETLVDLGLIRRLHHAGGVARFDGKVHRHHHLVCNVCHQVTDVEGPLFDDLALPPGEEHGFEIEDYSVHFFGVCPECRRKNEQS